MGWVEASTGSMGIEPIVRAILEGEVSMAWAVSPMGCGQQRVLVKIFHAWATARSCTEPGSPSEIHRSIRDVDRTSRTFVGDGFSR